MPIVSTGQFTITDANDAVSARLSNEFSGIPTNADGSGGNFTGCSTTITVSQGLQDITANGWSITALPSAGVSGTLVGQTYTVTGLSVDSGYVDLTATLAGGASLTKRFTVTKSKAGATGRYGLNFAEAKSLFTDPTFQIGTNTTTVYNNLANGTVTLTREAKQPDSPFADSGFNLKISNTGAATPGIGGFIHSFNGRASAVFVQRIVAKIPVGYTIDQATNSLGDGATNEWITSKAGTGKFEEYILVRRCGATGSFSNSGHIYLIGPAGSAGTPVNWYVAYAATYDFTSVGFGAITAVLSNETHTVPTDSAGNNGNFTGCATTVTIYNGTTDDSANWTVAATPVAGVTGSLAGKTYTVTAMTVDTGYVDLVASRSGYASVTKRFTLTKSKAGATGATGATGAAGANATFVKIVGCNYNAELAGFPGYGFTASNGAAITTKSIGHRLVVWNPATNDYYTPSVVYNTYGGGTASLVSALNAVPNGMIVCLLTQDASSCDAALRAVLQSFGSSMSSTWAPSRVTHVFIGMKGASPGQAYEATSTAADASGIVTLQAYYTASGLVLNGAAGASGANATAYWLTSSVPAVQKSIASVYTPAAVTYSMMAASGSDAPAAYAGRFIIATSTDGTTYTDQYTSAANESSKAYTLPANIKTVRVRAYLAGGTSTLLDELITTVVSDGATGAPGAAGANAVSAVLSNEAHVFSAATDGTVATYTGSGTDIRVYEGATELAYDGVGTANGTWKVTPVVSGITVGTLTDSGTYLTIGQHSGVANGTDTSSITYTITGKTQAGVAFTLLKTQTFAKSKQGEMGLDGEGGAYSLQKKFYVAYPIEPYLTVTNASTSSVGGATRVTHSAPGQLVFTGPGTQGHTIVISNVVCGVLAIRARFISGSGNFVGSVNVRQVARTGQYTYQDFYTSATFSTPADTNNWFTVFVDLTKQTSWQYNLPVKEITIVLFNGANAIYDVEYLGFCGAQPASAGAPPGTYVGDTPAETVVSKANGALQKAGDAIIGPVTFATNGGILAATDANNGVFMGPNGLVGKKEGATTFAIDTAGNASFGGTLNAASGTFAGTLTADAINAVNTINIANNAVTVPVSAVFSGSSVYPTNNQTVDIVTTVSSDFGGASVAIFATVTCTIFGGNAYLYGPGIEVIRDASTVAVPRMRGWVGYSDGTPVISGSVCSGLDSPGVGPHTYTVRLYFPGNISGRTYTVSHVSITAIGVKK